MNNAIPGPASQLPNDGSEGFDINTLLRRDRDRYRNECAETRTKYAQLQDSVEILKCENIDFKEELRKWQLTAATSKSETEDLKRQVELLRAELNATRSQHENDIRARETALPAPLRALDVEPPPTSRRPSSPVLEYVDISSKKKPEIQQLTPNTSTICLSDDEIEIVENGTKFSKTRPELTEIQQYIGPRQIPVCSPLSLSVSPSTRAATDTPTPSLIPYVSLPPIRSDSGQPAKHPLGTSHNAAAEKDSKLGMVPRAKRRKIVMKDSPQQQNLFTREAVKTISSANDTEASSSKSTNIASAPTMPRINRPVIKIKREAFRLASSSIASYLPPDIKPLTISPPPNYNFFVTRKFVRLAYGGSEQMFIQYTRDSKNPTDQLRFLPREDREAIIQEIETAKEYSNKKLENDATCLRDERDTRLIVWPMHSMNPSMPLFPGEPGIVFASRHEILQQPPWSLFGKRVTYAGTKVKGKGKKRMRDEDEDEDEDEEEEDDDDDKKENDNKATWSYLGEYKSTLIGKMTATEFSDQSDSVKREWGQFLLDQKRLDVYVKMRCRIALRKSGDWPAALDQKDCGLSQEAQNTLQEDTKELLAKEMLDVRKKSGRPLVADDVIAAFERGDEGIDVIRMECIAYDQEFAQDMQRQYEHYDAMVKADNRRKMAMKARQAKKKAIRKKPTSVVMGESADDTNEPVSERRATRSQWDPRTGTRIPMNGSSP